MQPADWSGPPVPPKQRSGGLIAAVAAAAVLVIAGAVAFGVPPVRHKVMGLFSSSASPSPISTKGEGQTSTDLLVNNPIDLTALGQSAADLVSPPAGFPNCSPDMLPVSWTEFSDGQLLVCGSRSQDFAVQLDGPAIQDMQVMELTFTDDGYELRLNDRSFITVQLGGALVAIGVTQGENYALIASQGWDIRSGVIAPTDGLGLLPDCPSGTWPIALSSWDGGWLRVCGEGPNQARYLDFIDDLMGEGTASDVVASGDGYCGTIADGTEACVYRSPALVKFSSGEVLIQQRSVNANAFAGQESGGAGQGTGAFGVPAPADTDRDQVRYLVEILDKSAGARAKLGPAVTATAACQNVASQVETIRSIADNRQDLLDALQQTPVDQVPGGGELVAQLTAALEESLGADQAYLAWAEAKRDSGCAASAGQGDYDIAGLYDSWASEAKRRFVDNWNATIAPQYGVPAFEEAQI